MLSRFRSKDRNSSVDSKQSEQKQKQPPAAAQEPKQDAAAQPVIRNHGPPPEDAKTSLAAFVNFRCPTESKLLIHEKRVRVMLPKAVVRDCVLKFNYEQNRILFGRDERWKYYELDHVENFMQGDPVVRAHCAIPSDATAQAKDFVAIPGAICSLSMKGLPSPFVFRFDTVAEREAFITTISACVEYSDWKPAPVTEELTKAGASTRAQSNSVRMTVEDSRILTGGGSDEAGNNITKSGRQDSKQWTTRPTNYWRSTG